jgi:hypothetical protein
MHLEYSKNSPPEDIFIAKQRKKLGVSLKLEVIPMVKHQV